MPSIAPFGEIPARFVGKTLYDEEFVAVTRAGHPFLPMPTLESYCEMRHLLVAPRGNPRGDVDEIMEKQGLSRRIVVAVPNFMLALDVFPQTELIAAMPKHFVEVHSRLFALLLQRCRSPLQTSPSRLSFRKWP